MKNRTTGFIAVAALTAGILAFRVSTGSVKGTVKPPDGAKRAWVISPTDTFHAGVRNGAFEIANVKTGIYQLIIEANAPYKNAVRNAVSVSEGAAFDVGEIILEKATH